MHGIIVLDKPPGITSRKCVDLILRLTKAKKAGHTGTLDPFATGILPICLGQATKIVEYIQSGTKTYLANLLLGTTTDTQDITGKVLNKLQEIPPIEFGLLTQVINSFIGEFNQKTPMFSARKINGVRLYKIARQNKQIETPSRKIVIKNISLIKYSHPNIEFEVTCSTGTYIRTLGADIGTKLGVGGTLVSLRRLRVANFTEKDAVTIEQLNQISGINGIKMYIHPIESGISHLPKASIKTEKIPMFERKDFLRREDFLMFPEKLDFEETIAVYSEKMNRLIGFAQPTQVDENSNIILKRVKKIDICETDDQEVLPEAQMSAIGGLQ